jgi:hypothetical protein
MEKEASREALVAALRERGLAYLAPSDARLGGESALTAHELIARLAAQDDARLRLALIPLFIRHPDIAQAVPQVVVTLPDPARTEAIACYMAAVYLQRVWSIRLGFYLPGQSPLPDWFSGEIGLPSPDERHGKVGLHALADWHAAHSLYPFNWLASYQRVMDQLFELLKQEARRREHAPAG